jgi:hypothetical protein
VLACLECKALQLKSYVFSILLKPVQTGEDRSIHVSLISLRRSIVNQRLPFSPLPPPLKSSISSLWQFTETSRRHESMMPGSSQNHHCEVCIPSPASNTTSLLPPCVPSPASNAAYAACAAPWALRAALPARPHCALALRNNHNTMYPHCPLVDLPTLPCLRPRRRRLRCALRARRAAATTPPAFRNISDMSSCSEAIRFVVATPCRALLLLLCPSSVRFNAVNESILMCTVQQVNNGLCESQF